MNYKLKKTLFVSLTMLSGIFLLNKEKIEKGLKIKGKNIDDTKVTINSNFNYTIQSLYVVLHSDNIDICYRKIYKREENLYNYYRLKDSYHVCTSLDKDYKIIKLNEVYSEEKSKSHYFEPTIDDIQNEINIEKVKKIIKNKK